MPTTAPAVKVEGTRAYGAEVQFAGTTSLHRMAAAEALQRERGLTMVPPFDDARIIAGQGTVGLELLGADARRDHRLRADGWRVDWRRVSRRRSRRARRMLRMVGVEPAGAPKMTESLAAGHPVTLAHSASISRIWSCLRRKRPRSRL
jgi:threonine dehydratase